MENYLICLVGGFFIDADDVSYLCIRAKTTPLLVYFRFLGLFPRSDRASLYLLLSCQLGSTLCGAAQNMTWLIVCRAFQGIGGGGIMQLSVITISDIVPLKECVQKDSKDPLPDSTDDLVVEDVMVASLALRMVLRGSLLMTFESQVPLTLF